MSETRNHRLGHAEALPADRSEILHLFADGWSVREPICTGDEHREGMLMGNCWNRIGLIEERGLIGGPAQVKAWQDKGAPDDQRLHAFFAEPSVRSFLRYGSLRDPDNLPCVSFLWQNRYGNLYVYDTLGRHNAHARIAYRRRIAAWAIAQGVPVVSKSLEHDGVLDEARGRVFSSCLLAVA
jgi:hypothetical protein